MAGPICARIRGIPVALSPQIRFRTPPDARSVRAELRRGAVRAPPGTRPPRAPAGPRARHLRIRNRPVLPRLRRPQRGGRLPVLSRRRRLQPLPPGPGRYRRLARRVPHLLYALPGRDLPGHADHDLRVPDDDLPAHRHDVANASMYDGSTAVPEAAMMAVRATGRNGILAARSVHPEYREVLRTYAR